MARRPERRARFRVAPEEIAKPAITLAGGELRHLRTVLRLAPGDLVEVFDGEGRGALAEIVVLDARSAELRAIEPIGHDRESPLALTLAVALSRGAKLDWVIEKATELGVAAILPFTSEHSQTSGERVERWRRIAEAAAAQCGRVRSPKITPVVPFDQMLTTTRACEHRLLFWERGTRPLGPGGASRRSLLVVTGPEGGFADAEAERAAGEGFDLIGLGPRILRAESAAIAVVVLAQYLWGDLGVG